MIAPDLQRAWDRANAVLAELTAAGVPEDDPRVQAMLGALDGIEYEVGKRMKDQPAVTLKLELKR